MTGAKVYDRFIAKVDKNGLGGCWLWTAAKFWDGYGQFMLNGKGRKAHRVSYMLHCEEIPDGMHVLHACDVRHCVNPQHLWLGTDADNQADKVKKGRDNPPRGERNHTSKLTSEQVRQIKVRLARGDPGAPLAREYGVSKHAVWSIKHGFTWAHVEIST